MATCQAATLNNYPTIYTKIFVNTSVLMKEQSNEGGQNQAPEPGKKLKIRTPCNNFAKNNPVQEIMYTFVQPIASLKHRWDNQHDEPPKIQT